MKFVSLSTILLITVQNHAMENIFHGANKTSATSGAYYSRGISEGEKLSLSNRLPIVKAALEKILNRSVENKKIPTIAVVASGGGYRAMLCTTGSLCGTQKIGLLGAVTYLAALSGSTWAVAPWISTGLPIKKFKEYIQTCVAKSFTDFTFEEKKLVMEALAIKNAYKQSLTLVDPYGFVLGNRFLDVLGDKRQSTTLSDQAHKVESGAYPYPIYTAIDGRETIETGQTWYRFTPHTVENLTNHICIPTPSYGKKFKNGKMVKDAPEKSLAYIMATCGSAFAANIYEMLKELIHNATVLEIIKDILPLNIGADRILPFEAKVSNYMYQMENAEDRNISQEKKLTLVDAGLEINLPFPAVKDADILIFLDASAGPVGEQLQNVVTYAQNHNIPFPTVNFDNIEKKTFSVFKDENNTAVPVVIYMPAISDPELWKNNKDKPEFAKYNLSDFDLKYQTEHGYCKTQNFQYEPEHSTLVMNQTEFNMRVNKDNIIKEINWWIDRT